MAQPGLCTLHHATPVPCARARAQTAHVTLAGPNAIIHGGQKHVPHTATCSHAGDVEQPYWLRQEVSQSHCCLQTHGMADSCGSGAGVGEGAGGAGGIGETVYTFGRKTMMAQRIRRACSVVNSFIQ